MAIEVTLDIDEAWPASCNWQALADKAITTAINVSAYPAIAKLPMVELSIAFASNDDVQTLNAEWRDKDKPTNILSFPMVEPEFFTTLRDDGPLMLGDLILAYDVCVREAGEKALSLEAHVTHLLIHGTLHLLGYDHRDDEEAEMMEALEIKALATLGLDDPYGDRE